MGTNCLGDHLSMGTKCLGTVCPGGPIVLGTICPWGPNFWGPIVQGDQLSWGPNEPGLFVLGDQLWGTKCLGTECVRDQMRISRNHHPKKLLRQTKIHFFPLTAKMAHTILCFKMWLKDQLYMELGLKRWRSGISAKKNNNWAMACWEKGLMHFGKGLPDKLTIASKPVHFWPKVKHETGT